jgi:hypothetical protein
VQTVNADGPRPFARRVGLRVIGRLTVRQPRAEDAVAREKGEEMRFVRKHLETVVVAAVTAFVVAAGPAVATAIVDVARNALHPGGKAPSAYVLKT